MKKLMKLIVLMIIMVMGVVILTGCGKEANTDDISGLAVYTADENMEGYTKCEAMAGVEFYYPSNYKSVGKATQPQYMDPDIFGASVNIVSQTFPSSLTFEGFIEASIAGVKQQMTIEGDIKTEYINLNGRKAAKLDYKATSQGQTMVVTQVVILKDTKVYLLTAGSLEKDVDAFAPKMEKIIKSLK